MTKSKPPTTETQTTNPISRDLGCTSMVRRRFSAYGWRGPSTRRDSSLRPLSRDIARSAVRSNTVSQKISGGLVGHDEVKDQRHA